MDMKRIHSVYSDLDMPTVTVEKWGLYFTG